MTTMGRRDLGHWAKEEIMDAIDAMIVEKECYQPPLEFDDWDILLRQRNRVAKMFGQPSKNQTEIKESD